MEVHRSHIREKLRISSAAELISYAARTADDFTKRASRTGLFSKLWFDFSVPLSDERRAETNVPKTKGKTSATPLLSHISMAESRFFY